MDSVNDDKARIILNEYKVTKTLHNAPTLYDLPFNIKTFKKSLQVVIVQLEDMEMEFDLIGIHIAIVNAFRRIMISDVPSMAVEQVHVLNNTSIIPDEILSHRLGLVPLKADPRLFEFKQNETPNSAKDTLEFELKVKCTWNKDDSKDSSHVDDKYKNNYVYSKSMKWLPIGNQSEIFKATDVGSVHDDILLAKMRPGQEIDVKLIAYKGIGRDHIKFSPVSPVYYRLLPDIRLTREVKDDQAVKLQSVFSKNVINLEKREDGHTYAVINDSRYDSCSRNVFKHEDLKDAVIMTKVKDHYIYRIESVGALTPDAIFIEAVKVLKNKCLSLLSELKES